MPFFKRRGFKTGVKPRVAKRTKKVVRARKTYTGRRNKTGHSGSNYVQQPAIINPWPRYSLTTFPERLFFQEQWCDLPRTISTTTAGVSSNSTIVYRLNSMYDAYFGASANLQPEYFGLLSQIYWRYFVTHVDLKIQFMDASGNGARPFVAIQNSEDTASWAGVTTDKVEINRSTQACQLTTGSGFHAVKELNWNNLDICRLEGINPSDLTGALEAYSADSGSSPNRTPYMRINMTDVNGTSGTTCICLVSIRFKGFWFKRINLNP